MLASAFVLGLVAGVVSHGALDDALDREPTCADLHAENRVRPTSCWHIYHLLFIPRARTTHTHTHR